MASPKGRIIPPRSPLGAVNQMLTLFVLASLIAPALYAQDRFTGTWKLVSCERRLASGEVTYPFGRNPVGHLSYDAQGHMMAQIMLPGRPKFQGRSMGAGTAREKSTAFDGYIAYGGTYTVNEHEHVVIHHVEVSRYPNWVGSDQRRTYEFSGGRLLLRAIDASGGPGTDARLVWERANTSK